MSVHVDMIDMPASYNPIKDLNVIESLKSSFF
jgi:hypothetical protein